jgi:DNA-3-methyladenine glycosylase
MDMARVIKAGELQQKNTVALARWLLGKVLVRTTTEAGADRHVITEVEAYHGESDLACHASKGRTKRTETMYKAGGCWYVYLCYGVHEMLNLVTGPEGQPAAILLRGLDRISGPGRLTKRLLIDRSLNGALAAPVAGLHLEDHGIVVPRAQLRRGPRIGVDYAGPVWAAKPWRFWVEGPLI